MILLYLSILSPLAPLLVGWKKRLTLLWVYPFIGLIFDIVVFSFKRILFINNAWVGNTFILVEFFLLSFLWRDKVFSDKRIFGIAISFLSLFYIFWGGRQLFSAFNMLGTSIFMFTYIIYGILGFYYLLNTQQEIFLEKSWFFWFNTAITIYASGNFLLLLFMDYLLQLDRQMFFKIWYSLFQILNITKNLLIAVALYRYKPVLRESH